MGEADQGMAMSSGSRTPLDSIRLDKTAFSVISFADADADVKSFWKAQSTRARLEALELMRQVMYGYDPITDQS